MKNLKKAYAEKSLEIQARLKEFRALPETQYKKELIFCLLTPQSSAKKCWLAAEQIAKLKSPNKKNISKILKSKTRFHNNKTDYVLQALKNYSKIISELKNQDVIETRNQLAKNVKGLGMKEASHFLRNIGKSNNQLAILDRHILKNLNIQKIKSQKHYLETEKKFLQTADELKIPADELDLLLWSSETGEVFK